MEFATIKNRPDGDGPGRDVRDARSSGIGILLNNTGSPLTNTLGVKDADANKYFVADDVTEGEAASSNLWLLNAIYFGCFGGGKYKFVPIAWGLLFAVNSFIVRPILFKKVHLPYTLYYEIIMTVSNLHNLYFGWHWLTVKPISILIFEECTTVESRKTARKVLNALLWFASIMSLVSFVVGCIVTPRVVASLGTASTVDEVAWYVYYGTVAYTNFLIVSLTLIVVWLWLCWLKYAVGQRLADSISPETLMDDRFINAFNDDYVDMRLKSDFWNHNQLLRIPSTIVYGFVTVLSGLRLYDESKYRPGLSKVDQDYFLYFSLQVLFFCGFFYLLIWLSIAIGGFINDRTYGVCARLIASMKFANDDPSIAAADLQLQKERFEARRMQVLARMLVIAETNGFTFARLHLTAKNTATVGTVLFSVISYSLKH